ncbi:MAG: hypothetical protein AAGF83_12645 [Cyanobacteria bacterium P01_G01_bin.67]
MTDYKSNYFSELEFSEDYHLIYVPETILPIEKEGYSMLKPQIDYTQPSDRRILFALGLISTLLLFSGIQLQRAFNTSPHKLSITGFPKISILNQKQLTTKTPTKEYKQQHRDHQIELLSIRNAIAHLKF